MRLPSVQIGWVLWSTWVVGKPEGKRAKITDNKNRAKQHSSYRRVKGFCLCSAKDAKENPVKSFNTIFLTPTFAVSTVQSLPAGGRGLVYAILTRHMGVLSFLLLLLLWNGVCECGGGSCYQNINHWRFFTFFRPFDATNVCETCTRVCDGDELRERRNKAFRIMSLMLLHTHTQTHIHHVRS